MKKISFCLIALCLLLASCSKTEPENAIPKNIMALMALDMNSIYQKADAQQLSKQISNHKLFASLLSDPSEAGIDWSDKVYIYMDENAPGVVATVSDRGDLDETLKNAGLKVQEDGDYHWASTTGLLIGYSKNVLVGTTMYGDEKLFRQRIRQQIEQDASKSFSSTTDFDKVQAEKKDLAAYMSAGILALPLGQFGSLTSSLDLSALSCLLGVDFEKGALNAQAQIYGQSQEQQQALDEFASSYSKVTGVFLDKAPADASFFFTTCADKLSSLAMKNQSVGMLLTMLGQSVPVGDVLKSLNGDVAISVSGMNDQLQPKNLLVYAQMKDTSVLKDADSWTQGGEVMNVRSQGEGQYSLSAFGKDYFFGAKDNNFYLTNSTALLAGEGTGCQRLQDKSLKDCYGFLWMDVQRWVESAIPSEFKPLLSPFDELTLRAVQPLTYELQLTAVDKQQNMLGLLLEKLMMLAN